MASPPIQQQSTSLLNNLSSNIQISETSLESPAIIQNATSNNSNRRQSSSTDNNIIDNINRNKDKGGGKIISKNTTEITNITALIHSNKMNCCCPNCVALTNAGSFFLIFIFKKF